MYFFLSRVFMPQYNFGSWAVSNQQESAVPWNQCHADGRVQATTDTYEQSTGCAMHTAMIQLTSAECTPPSLPPYLEQWSSNIRNMKAHNRHVQITCTLLEAGVYNLSWASRKKNKLVCVVHSIHKQIPDKHN